MGAPGVRKHVQRVELGLGRVHLERRAERGVLLPVALPALLNLPERVLPARRSSRGRFDRSSGWRGADDGTGGAARRGRAGGAVQRTCGNVRRDAADRPRRRQAPGSPRRKAAAHARAQHEHARGAAVQLLDQRVVPSAGVRVAPHSRSAGVRALQASSAAVCCAMRAPRALPTRRAGRRRAGREVARVLWCVRRRATQRAPRSKICSLSFARPPHHLALPLQRRPLQKTGGATHVRGSPAPGACQQQQPCTAACRKEPRPRAARQLRNGRRGCVRRARRAASRWR
jgi:hypothetical protein